MDIVKTFLPIAENLIGNVFPTSITYIRNSGSSYDPATGDVTPNSTAYEIKAGVLFSARTEQGGVGEDHELSLYIEHGPTGMPHMPTTADEVEYGGLTWKVTTVDPTYRSEGLISSKITARHS